MSETLRAATFLDKGGTGKTTVTSHLGVACARQGHEVLLIDLAGKQGDLGKQFGIHEDYQREIESEDAWPNISTAFRSEWSSITEKLGEDVVEEFIHRTGERVDVIPAHPGLDSLDAELAEVGDPRERYTRLNDFLDEYIDPLRYDLVLIDLPGVTNNITFNGLCAAQHVIAPVQPTKFGMSQLCRLEDDLERMQDRLGTQIELTMVIPTAVDLRTKLADRYLETFREEYSDTVGPWGIPKSQDIRNSAAEGHTVFRLESPSKTAKQSRQAFIKDAEALVDRLQASEVEDT
ncbi:ParA family protein [Halobellus sp. EA9]|uniref:ParA family protein n=1 Tax=Halobellus sp. EA9 TaxID=3421647 RepID=UPI003EBEA19E